MKKTRFYAGRNISVLISETKRGNKKAEAAIIKEITRLENRIRELENAEDTELYLLPNEVEL